jgi:deazaflavin-dependent oxidoreductase (nitroreductase family)
VSDPVGRQLVGWGKVAMVETRSHDSSRRRSTAVGFVERPDGSLVVAAGAPQAGWAVDLVTEPRCRVTIGEHAFDAVATELAGPEHAEAVRDLILKYGTPAERLGSGPAFLLRPARS